MPYLKEITLEIAGGRPRRSSWGAFVSEMWATFTAHELAAIAGALEDSGVASAGGDESPALRLTTPEAAR